VWLTAQKFAHPAHQIVFQDQIEAINAAQVRLATLEQQLRDIVPTWTMAPVVAAYQALRGGPPCVCKFGRGLLGSAEQSLNA
jgi:hypothetical protein